MGAAGEKFEEERITESSDLEGTHEDHGVHLLSLQRKEIGDSDLVGEEVRVNVLGNASLAILSETSINGVF